MQVSSLNEVKIYSLSCGKSLPEVSHFPAPSRTLWGRPPRGTAAPLLGPSVCFSWTLVSPRLGEAQRRLTVSWGGVGIGKRGHCRHRARSWTKG